MTGMDPFTTAQQLAMATNAANGHHHLPAAPAGGTAIATVRFPMTPHGSSISFSLPGNTMIMPLRMNSGKEHNNHHFDGEMLLLDSGAEYCVCPKSYAPECPTEQVPPQTTPNLVTVMGDPMQV